MTPKERNELFTQNSTLINKICRRIVRHINRQFPGIDSNDLLAYAYQGIMDAIERADPENPGFESFLGKYGYITAMDGAMLMLGLPRRRSRNSDEQYIQLYSAEPLELNEYIETHQEIDWNLDLTFNDVIEKIDMENFASTLVGSYEYIVLQSLLDGMQLKDISKRYHLGVRKIRKHGVRLCQIYMCALSDKPYDKYITRIRNPMALAGLQIRNLRGKDACAKRKVTWIKLHQAEIFQAMKRSNQSRLFLALNVLHRVKHG